MKFIPSLTPLSTAITRPTKLPPSLTPSITPTPVPEIQQNCLQILPALPQDRSYSGELVLKGDEVFTDKGFYYDISVLDLSTHQFSSLTSNKPEILETSPDGKKYAVSFVGDPNVNVYSADGQLLNRIPPDGECFLGQWLDDTRLVFVYGPNLVIVRVTSYEYPRPWESGDTTKYARILSRVEYREMNGGIRLWDVEHETLLTEIESGDLSATPRWAPDGSKVAILGRDGELYLFSRDSHNPVC